MHDIPEDVNDELHESCLQDFVPSSHGGKASGLGSPPPGVPVLLCHHQLSGCELVP